MDRKNILMTLIYLTIFATIIVVWWIAIYFDIEETEIKEYPSSCGVHCNKIYNDHVRDENCNEYHIMRIQEIEDDDEYLCRCTIEHELEDYSI